MNNTSQEAVLECTLLGKECWIQQDQLALV
jgi:hypothetical protein